MEDLIIAGFFVAPFIFYLGFKAFSRIKLHRNWQAAEDQDLDEDDRSYLRKSFRPYQFLSAEEISRLESKIRYFLAHKRIEPVGEVKVDREMKLIIAAQACLILTNLDVCDVYPGLKNIYIMADSYVEKDNPVNPHTGLPSHMTRLGEAWKRGPIVLSWRSIQQSMKAHRSKENLIIHEFSHQLDQQDGHFDGTPPIDTQDQSHAWARVMGKEFESLRSKVVKHQQSDIDDYGATNEAEFFAVCTEYFFTDPRSLQIKHPEIFGIFHSYFLIDPRRWC